MGFFRLETKEFVLKEVPVEFFQNTAFGEKRYLREALLLAKRALFLDLKTPHEEPIRICRGYVLSSIYGWLKGKKFDCETTTITGWLQNRMEGVSRDYVNSLPNFLKQKSESLYDALIRWLKEDFSRLKYAKTGWKSMRLIVRDATDKKIKS